jgi:hypothetical protein
LNRILKVIKFIGSCWADSILPETSKPAKRQDAAIDFITKQFVGK